MKHSALAAQRQQALHRLAAASKRLAAGKDVPDFDQLPKGDTEHRQLFLIQRLADFLETLSPADDGIVTVQTLDNITLDDMVSEVQSINVTPGYAAESKARQNKKK